MLLLLLLLLFAGFGGVGPVGWFGRVVVILPTTRRPEEEARWIAVPEDAGAVAVVGAVAVAVVVGVGVGVNVWAAIVRGLPALMMLFWLSLLLSLPLLPSGDVGGDVALMITSPCVPSATWVPESVAPGLPAEMCVFPMSRPVGWAVIAWPAIVRIEDVGAGPALDGWPMTILPSGARLKGVPEMVAYRLPWDSVVAPMATVEGLGTVRV